MIKQLLTSNERSLRECKSLALAHCLRSAKTARPQFGIPVQTSSSVNE